MLAMVSSPTWVWQYPIDFPCHFYHIVLCHVASAWVWLAHTWLLFVRACVPSLPCQGNKIHLYIIVHFTLPDSTFCSPRKHELRRRKISTNPKQLVWDVFRNQTQRNPPFWRSCSPTWARRLTRWRHLKATNCSCQTTVFLDRCLNLVSSNWTAIYVKTAQTKMNYVLASFQKLLLRECKVLEYRHVLTSEVEFLCVYGMTTPLRIVGGSPSVWVALFHRISVRLYNSWRRSQTLQSVSQLRDRKLPSFGSTFCFYHRRFGERTCSEDLLLAGKRSNSVYM